MSEVAIGHGHACGKVILFGEHAVVYGVPAIAAGILRGAHARCTKAETSSIAINGSEIARTDATFHALERLRIFLGVGPARVELDLELPPGAGLGASAALGVATVRGLLDLFERPSDDRRVFHAAQTWERVFHGNPSGIDVAAAQSAGPLRFSRSTEPETLLMNKALLLVIAQAGPPASTKEMVEGVARLKERNPTQFQKTIDAIQSLVENATLLLRSGDLGAVGKLMDLNHMLLAGWMLSTRELEEACRRAREQGALGAKLTGSGGGGCVIALAGEADNPEDEARAGAILDTWKSAGFPCFSSKIHGGMSES